MYVRIQMNLALYSFLDKVEIKVSDSSGRL